MIIYSDSPLADTGFACVVRNIVDRYQAENTKVFGINHYETETQYKHVEIIPAMSIREALKDKPDAYGFRRFERLLESEKEPDVLLTILDPQVVTNVLSAIKKYQARGGKWIAYWPIDSHILVYLKDVITSPDEIVFYTEYGRRQVLDMLEADAVSESDRFVHKLLIEKVRNAHVIPHGVDSTIFRAPESKAEAMKYRRAILDDPRFECDDDTQIFVSVNRNQPRKNFPQLIRAFARYQQIEKNSRLLLHCAKKDTLGDIEEMCIVYGLRYGRDVILPKQDEDTLPADKMFIPYFCADAFITTTYGEGWGLTISEAAACGLPVIAPDNTCISEVLGPCDMKFMFDAKLPAIIGEWDMYRTRFMAWDEDIIEEMSHAIDHKGHHKKSAEAYARAFDWNDIVADRWAPLFDAVKAQL